MELTTEIQLKRKAYRDAKKLNPKAHTKAPQIENKINDGMPIVRVYCRSLYCQRRKGFFCCEDCKFNECKTCGKKPTNECLLTCDVEPCKNVCFNCSSKCGLNTLNKVKLSRYGFPVEEKGDL